jgi:hypothetical protein
VRVTLLCAAAAAALLTACHSSKPPTPAPPTPSAGSGSVGASGSGATTAATGSSGSSGSSGSAAPTSAPTGGPPHRIAMFATDECSHARGADANALFEKACTAKDGDGCVDLALQMRCGVGGEPDQSKAQELSGRACDLGSKRGCSFAAKMAMELDDHAQPGAAMKYAQAGCKLGDDEACGYIGVFYWQGIGVPQDPARAAKIFGEQCSGVSHNMMSCANLAVQLYMGDGIAKDLPRAKQLADVACKADMQAACNIMGAILMSEGGDANAEQALALFQKMCDENASASCDNLGQLWVLGAGKFKTDPDKARAAFKKGCDLGNGPACTHLGEM